MQRNILKKMLVCGISLLLASTPINGLYAAENAIETNINLDDSISGTYYVNAQHGLKMRSAPSTNADVLTLLPYQTEVTVIGAATDNWYQVEYANQSGYVAADYLTKSTSVDTDTESADTQTTETQESTLSSEENRSDTFGTTSIITALIAAIIIMVILALYTAYSFLKKETNDEIEDYDSDYEDDEDDDDDLERNDDDDARYETNDSEYDEDDDDDEYDDDES